MTPNFRKKDGNSSRDIKHGPPCVFWSRHWFSENLFFPFYYLDKTTKQTNENPFFASKNTGSHKKSNLRGLKTGQPANNQLERQQKTERYSASSRKKEAKIGTSEAQKKFVPTIKTLRPDD